MNNYFPTSPKTLSAKPQHGVFLNDSPAGDTYPLPGKELLLRNQNLTLSAILCLLSFFRLSDAR